MSYALRIAVDASLQDSWLIHRVLNFKEDIHREFLRSGAPTITDSAAVDRALEPLTITIASKRYLGSVNKFIEKALLRSEVAANIRVERLN